jgi:hypothetical protein
MLDENEVMEAVSFYLLERGYAILQESATDRRGVDIVAYHPESKAKIFVSVAGIARSKAGRGKLETAYTESQVLRSVARGIYSAMKMGTPDHFIPGDQIAIGFSDTPTFRKYLEAEKPVMDSFGIKIFLVSEEKKITVL